MLTAAMTSTASAMNFLIDFPFVVFDLKKPGRD